MYGKFTAETHPKLQRHTSLISPSRSLCLPPSGPSPRASAGSAAFPSPARQRSGRAEAAKPTASGAPPRRWLPGSLASSYLYAPQQGSKRGNDGHRWLVDIIRIIPDLSRNYFRSQSRRALFGGISLLGGFYVAQTISLSFGVLGVNDVIAAAVCVLLTEYVTKFYYSRPKVTFRFALLNNFKMGFTYGLFIDAFKLAS